MRPLTEEETRIFFTKLAKYIGKNIQYLIDRTDSTHVFRLHNQRIYYVNELLLIEAQNCANDKLVSLGTCFGKFTKTNKFHLHITCLQCVAQYIKYKIWIKPNGEMSYLYGNNVLKTHLGRISESTPQYAGVVFYSMSDIPLGFGVTAYSTVQCRTVDATAVIAFHQSDIGEYLRIEDSAEVGADESVPVSKKQKQYNGNADDNDDEEQNNIVNKQQSQQKQQYNKQKFNENNSNNKRNGTDHRQQYNNKKHKSTAG